LTKRGDGQFELYIPYVMNTKDEIEQALLDLGRNS